MPDLAIVLTIVFAAMLVRGTFGFGDALVGMPLLVLAVGTDVAAPLIALLSAVIAAGILAQDWRNVHFRPAAMLIVPALAGIVVGLFLLREVREDSIVGLLGGVLVGFGAYSLFRPHVLELKTDRPAPLFGFVAGILSGAYNAPGPPLVIYGAMRRWSPQQFRATMQAFFLPTSIAVVIGHHVEGRLTSEVLTYFAFSLPIVAVCLLLGRRLNARLTAENFAPVLHALIVVLGALLLKRALWT